MIQSRRLILLLGLSVLMACQASSSAEEEETSFNVLFLAIDDLNDWIGCMGTHPDVRTPNLDRLAQRSVLFTNAHCQAPICGPSRSSLLSGLYPSTTGIYAQIRTPGLMRNETIQKTTFLPKYFEANGYHTMGAGKIFHDAGPEDAFQEYAGRLGGFGPKPKERFKYTPPPGVIGNTQTDWGAFPESDDKMPDYKIAEFAVQKLKSNLKEPFFLAAGFYRPHVPWYVPDKWFENYPLDRITEPEIDPNDLDDLPEISRQVHEIPAMPQRDWMIANNETTNAVQAYLASITFVDAQVGKVLNALEKSPYLENTIVVLFSDHGYHLGEKHRWAKHSLWEEATKVPLMIYVPGMKRGNKCSKPAGLIDIYPTLLDLCGLPPNAMNEGKSLRTLLENPKAQWNRPISTVYGRNNVALRTETHRYIHYENGEEELYDHQKDPNEWKNLAGSEQYRNLMDELKNYLPSEAALWDTTSNLGVNTYFIDHIERN